MLSLRSGVVRVPTYNPKMDLLGMPVLDSCKLPSLDLVGQDAAKLPTLVLHGIPRVLELEVSNSTQEDNILVNPSECLVWNAMMPQLCVFSLYCRAEDVGTDLLPAVIFALQWTIRVLEECSDHELRMTLWLAPHQTGEVANYVRRTNLWIARNKVSRHLMDPAVNQPAMAVPYLSASIEMSIAIEGARGWEHYRHPMLYCLYGEALSLSGELTHQTKIILERALDAAENSPTEQSIPHDFGAAIIKIRTHLARVLHALDIEPDAQKRHTEQVVKFLKKNPTLFYEGDLLQLLVLPEEVEHPVLTALGGPRWIESRRASVRADERQIKLCRGCGARDINNSLFRCSRCQHAYYCCRKCQKSNWNQHKKDCNEIVLSREKARVLSQTNPTAGQRYLAWSRWATLPNSSRDRAFCSALGLHRDPSRGQTHMIICKVEWVPENKDPRFQFRITRCGVVRISEMAARAETVLNSERDETQAYIKTAVDALEVGNPSEHVQMVPIYICFMMKPATTILYGPAELR